MLIPRQQDEVADAAPVIKENLKSIWSATVAGNDPDSAALCAGRPYRSILCRIYVILFTKVGATGVFDAASEWSKLALNQTTRLEIRM